MFKEILSYFQDYTISVNKDNLEQKFPDEDYTTVGLFNILQKTVKNEYYYNIFMSFFLNYMLIMAWYSVTSLLIYVGQNKILIILSALFIFLFLTYFIIWGILAMIYEKLIKNTQLFNIEIKGIDLYWTTESMNAKASEMTLYKTNKLKNALKYINQYGLESDKEEIIDWILEGNFSISNKLYKKYMSIDFSNPEEMEKLKLSKDPVILSILDFNKPVIIKWWAKKISNILSTKKQKLQEKKLIDHRSEIEKQNTINKLNKLQRISQEIAEMKEIGVLQKTI